MSYFDFFCTNLYSNSSKEDTGVIRGSCYSMCPHEEAKMRQREKLIHVLEVVGDSHKLVKSFSRSAADTTIAYPHLLRPYTVLRDTVQYLLFDVTKRNNVPVSVIYDFVNDRLRSVRQDMTIQRFDPSECASLLDPMVRFYVYFGYKLCQLPVKDFDSTLNKKYLLECLKWYLSCSDNSKKQNDKDISNFFSNLNIEEKGKLPQDRADMESLYILCNLDDIHPLYRYLMLPKDLKCDPKIKLAYKLAISNLNGNYIVVGRLSEKLCPLSYYAFAVSLSSIQRRALKVMSHAYNSKQLTVPVETVKTWLKFPSKVETRTTCSMYGLTLIKDGVKFSKTDFKNDVTLHMPCKDPLKENSFF